MTNKIPEWAREEANVVLRYEPHGRIPHDIVDRVARALVATAGRVERERRDMDIMACEHQDERDAQSGYFGTSGAAHSAVAIRALPLKYQEN